MVSELILQGREIIEEHRKKHASLYESDLNTKEIIEAHKPLIDEMRKQLQEIGFSDERKLIKASEEADKEEGKKTEDFWR